MPEDLSYHRRLDDGTVLSLQFCHPSRERVEAREQHLLQEAAGHEVQHFESQIVSQRYDQQIHALYTAEIYSREFPDEDIASLTRRESLIVETLLEAFRSIEKKWEQEGDPLKWYKRPELRRIVEEVTGTQWRQPVPNVAGCLLSNLIFGHGLPNANHRSSLSLVETYLGTFKPDFEIPDTGVHGEWFDWSEEYVHESKRLLMLARKAKMFRYIEDWGCTSIVRKNDVVAAFEDYNIWVDDPWSHFRQQHRELSIEFVYQILERTEYDTLIGEQDPGKRVFLDRLAATQ
ncbi:hypothetical protein HUG10_11605 [Halorarum halophilum]|uniref:Uncharacterized protein n=1 Tax=Halorarum halophilum TaxID=2743090 RepID=A0A7D5K8G4_9EURY|nr:hypothetical protein [Halobaculum halophilum]QLG28154.1 hypothetical protein HUG10_11605 [Halobaculum halophilum]